jgi:hypothetical protein
MDEGYWRHATDIAAMADKKSTSERGKTRDWSFLQHYHPLDFPTDDEQCRGRIPGEMAGLILSKLKRPGKIEVYSDFSLQGVRLSFFQRFIDENGGEEAFRGLTTTDVKDRFILGPTRESSASYCELLTACGETDVVGTAQVLQISDLCILVCCGDFFCR